MTKLEIIRLLESNGLAFIHEKSGSLVFNDCGDRVGVVFGHDWEVDRWMSSTSHIDSLLRRAQA